MYQIKLVKLKTDFIIENPAIDISLKKLQVMPSGSYQLV